MIHMLESMCISEIRTSDIGHFLLPTYPRAYCLLRAFVAPRAANADLFALCAAHCGPSRVATGSTLATRLCGKLRSPLSISLCYSSCLYRLA